MLTNTTNIINVTIFCSEKIENKPAEAFSKELNALKLCINGGFVRFLLKDNKESTNDFISNIFRNLKTPVRLWIIINEKCSYVGKYDLELSQIARNNNLDWLSDKRENMLTLSIMIEELITRKIKELKLERNCDQVNVVFQIKNDYRWENVFSREIFSKLYLNEKVLIKA